MDCPPMQKSPSLDSDEDESSGQWEDWVDPADEDSTTERFLCLFCETNFTSSALVFQHCRREHAFDFYQLRKDYELDFYDCVRLINFIRSKVAGHSCWSCGLVHSSQDSLLKHLRIANHVYGVKENEAHVTESVDKGETTNDHLHLDRLPWQDNMYLTPFLEGDPLLYNFEEDLDDNGEEQNLDDVEDTVSLLRGSDLEGCILNKGDSNGHIHAFGECSAFVAESLTESAAKEESVAASENLDLLAKKKQKNNLKVSFVGVAEKERYSINQNYFGSYSAFGIHREMLSDKIRTEAYQTAIMSNPSLLTDAVVMDLGCGTGILSLFAAKAGAKRVIAVEGSEKMSSVAQQVAKANDYWIEAAGKSNNCKKHRMITVVQGMIEEVELETIVGPDQVDVLVSEWMGYCLLFESMLNSVIFARDRWLRPGGAILPDVAEMYVAGFGRGGTSLPFWENVYGFDMQCIGKEVLEDAAVSPIVDTVESKDIVTDACLIQAFDLVTLKAEDVDFTAKFNLKPSVGLCKDSQDHPSESMENSSITNSNGALKFGVIWCYGLVLWFDISFTNRFCREAPVVLSTSPHSPKTHWSQTLLTFREPICLSISGNVTEHVTETEPVGVASSPAISLQGRISIAQSFRHRSIDISLEIAAVGATGVVRTWPAQIFDL